MVYSALLQIKHNFFILSRDLQFILIGVLLCFMFIIIVVIVTSLVYVMIKMVVVF